MAGSKLEWEYICGSTWRLKVFGGWLVRNSSSGENEELTSYSCSESMCFISDLDHKWLIT